MSFWRKTKHGDNKITKTFITRAPDHPQRSYWSRSTGNRVSINSKRLPGLQNENQKIKNFQDFDRCLHAIDWKRQFCEKQKGSIIDHGTYGLLEIARRWGMQEICRNGCGNRRNRNETNFVSNQGGGGGTGSVPTHPPTATVEGCSHPAGLDVATGATEA